MPGFEQGGAGVAPVNEAIVDSDITTGEIKYNIVVVVQEL